jgi:hypothetical protein
MFPNARFECAEESAPQKYNDGRMSEATIPQEVQKWQGLESVQILIFATSCAAKAIALKRRDDSTN